MTINVHNTGSQDKCAPTRVGYCTGCGYSLQHQMKGDCPECGRGYDLRNGHSYVKYTFIVLNAAAIAAIGIAAYPISLTVLIYSSWTSARITLGQYPQPSMNAPSVCVWALLYYPTLLIIRLFPVAVLAQVSLIIYALIIELKTRKQVRAAPDKLRRIRAWVIVLAVCIPILTWPSSAMFFKCAHPDIIPWMFD